MQGADDASLQLGGVDTVLDSGEVSDRVIAEAGAVQEALVGCPALVVAFHHSGALPLLADQLPHRSQEVELRPEEAVELLQKLLAGC